MILQLERVLPREEIDEFVRGGWEDAFSWEVVMPQLLRVGVILLLAFVVYRLVRIFTGRLQREIEEEDPTVKRAREQRARTLASLLNSIALVVIVGVTVLTILGTLIDIGPLLATAGVAGLAISFGAQSLVKDFITGIFIIIEGQFGIGDVVRIGETAGLVEKMTLRTTVLRDLEGVVHTIPNGEISKVSNLTKTFSRSVLDIGVAYRERVDDVIAVLKSVGTELQADPAWRDLLIEEPSVLGVERFEDSAVVVRMVTKTLPLKQWDVSRELRRRIKNRFDREGIEIPYPHVTFYWGEDQVPRAFRISEDTAAQDRGSSPESAGEGRAADAVRHTEGDPFSMAVEQRRSSENARS